MMKMKLNKKIAGASAMLMLSATMLGTSTFAWFTMNKEVSVTGMQLKAQATDGIVISGDNKANWKTDWDVAMPTGVALYPTSTSDTATPAWAVAYSKNFDNADKNQTSSGSYTDLTINYDASAASGTAFVSGVDGVGKTANPNRNYVLKKTFWIKSTGEQAWATSLNIDEVKAVVATQGSGSGTAKLDQALRVLVVVNGTDHYIYAPITGYDNECKYKGTTALTLVPSTTSKPASSVASIPNTDAGAIRVDMYMYYEGEDKECKSSNITAVSVDTLKVSAKFSTTVDPRNP